MLKTNIPGGILIVLVVLGIIGYAFSLRLSLEWGFYFKMLGIVAVFAVLVSVITHFIPSRNRQ